MSLPEEVVTAIRDAGADIGKMTPLFEPGEAAGFIVPVAGRHGAEMWRRLREMLPAHGYWPAILGDDSSLRMLREGMADERCDLIEVIRRADSVDMDEFFARRRDGLRDPDDPNGREPEDGDWPETVHPHTSLATLCHYTGKFLQNVWIGLIPTADDCEVPAYLSYGDWNECPPPHEHVAVLKYWHRRYGTELVAATHDVIELKAARRPVRREEAMALARQQYYYCSDIVDQGVGSIAALAAMLMESDFWYFWWD